MMCKVLLKDQYTSGYAKKIAGSYTLVAGFRILQYVSVYILYTEGIMRNTDVVWKVRIQDSYIRSRISYSSLHMTVYILYTA